MFGSPQSDWLPTMLAADQGNTLLEFIPTTEDAAPAFQPLTGALVVARWDDRYLFVFHHDRHRRQWEIPGGSIEEGETPRECAAREFKEETNQEAKSLHFCGLAKTATSNGFTEYTSLFSAVLDELSPFQRNDEIERIALWDLKQDIGEVNPIDRKLVDYA